MVIFGTRPEAIKVAPVIRALKEAPGFRPLVAVTAQHRSMLDQVLDLFEVVPEHDLNIIRDRQSLTGVTVRALEGLAPLIETERPDAVVVQGDTTTTFAGALAAFYNRVPVVHVEAGLRTGDRYSPYPEEVNRSLTTRLASLHLAPTRNNKRSLLDENVDSSSIVVTGNTVIDALLHTVEKQVPYEAEGLKDLEGDPRRVVLVTAHRRESWGEPMIAIGAAVAELATVEPDVRFVFPIHKNPLVRESIVPQVGHLENVTITEPLPYGSFASLIARSHLVLTDSGGVQEEAPSLGKPVLVMRDTTERPEAVDAGTVKLVGANFDSIVSSVRQLLNEPLAYEAMAGAVNPYGDGRAAERTVGAIAHWFGDGPPVVEFRGERASPEASPATGGGENSEASKKLLFG